MTKSEAEALADSYVKNILENQQGVFMPRSFEFEEHALQSAKALAAFRKELVKELQSQ